VEKMYKREDFAAEASRFWSTGYTFFVSHTCDAGLVAGREGSICGNSPPTPPPHRR